MAAGPTAEIEDRFRRLPGAAQPPADLAVFTRLESEGRLHCEVVAYFSPAAHELAEAFDADPCERPQWHGLGLLVGDPRAWAVLFPEKGQ